MTDLVPVRRALLSVSDKSGLADFATALYREFAVELISTGGTAKFLRDAGLPVTDVADVTGFPEMMDGRVKTLHPAIHGGLLALRDHADHVAAMAAHGIRPIDLVCINLYPFARTIADPAVTLDDAIENIDIGGPSMIRSAAKNNAWVLVVTSPGRYEKVLDDLRQHAGATCAKHRLKQAQSAFAHTAEYDGLIAKFLAKRVTPEGAHDRSGEEKRAIDVVGSPTANPSSSDRAAWLKRLLPSANFLPDYLLNIVAAQVKAVGGTTGVVFGMADNGNPPSGLAVMHRIGIGIGKEQPGQPALTTIEPFVRRCIEQGQDGAISISIPPDADGVGQSCLVTLLRGGTKIMGVSAVICNGLSSNVALQRLNSMQVIAGYVQLASDIHGWEDVRQPPTTQTAEIPENLALSLVKRQDLRYGENPHQKASLYVGDKPHEASVAFAKQHHGKELSYINLLDADGALACVKEFAAPAACIVKHTTPCGCATADDVGTAFDRAYAGDPLAAFGGIVAVNRPIDLAAAKAITSIDKLLEVIVAPYYAEDALELLRGRWKNVRLLEVGPVVQGGDDRHPARRDAAEVSLHKIVGGYLVQERDLLGLDESTWAVASTRQPTEAEMADLRFAWLTCKHVKSNAIVVCKGRMLLGAGAGQMDRPSAARLAIAKAGDRVAGGVAASDAFFPFPDGPRLLLDAGVTAIIHPGGSLKDRETIDLVNDRGAVLVLTGQRHFKH